jgi:general secretion pathway protein D
VAPAAAVNPANAVTSVPAATPSPLEEPLPQGMIDFRSADLTQVLEIYSTMVNRTILRPATLPAPTVTLTTRGQLTMREGIQALEAVLALNGITMINMGDKFVKAMPEAQGNTAGGRFDTNGAAQLPEMGQYVTHVVQLKYAKPSEMVAVLQPFVKIPNAILPIDTSQILVLRDYTENIKRMLEMIERIDVAIPSEFVSEVIPIKYAKASEIASALNSLSSGGGGAALGGGGATGTRSTRTSGTGMNRTGGTSGYPGQTTPGMGTQPGMTGTTPTAAPGSSFSSRLQNIINRASSSGEIQVLGQTKIISDERTNSLLIYAGKDDMKTIKEIISKLDVVLAQVLIDAAIISVELDDNRSLGFSYIQQTPSGSGYLKGIGAINNGNSLSQSPLVSAATNITTLPGGFSYLASFGQDLDVTMTAAAGNSRTKILQRPRIQTSHNEPATLFVGSTQPYPTASYYGGGAYGGNTSIQQMQIGVTIEVTPLINPDGLVVMEIHTKIDDVTGSVNIANVGDVPITSSKEASSKVSVRDHDTIILGGMIYTKRTRGANGVPLLMDIPLLGYLFRNSTADDTRSELIVLIRPTVLPTPEIAALAATAEKNKMPGVRGFEREQQADETRRLKQADKADKMNSYQPVEKP